MTEITFAQLGWIIGLAGVVFGIWGQVRNGKAASDTAAREMGTLLTRLDFVSRQLDTLQAQVCATNNVVLDLASRLGAVEKAAERAHIRLDRMDSGNETHSGL